MFCAVFTITYPWSFLSSTIPYQEEIQANTNQCLNSSTIQQETPPGCPHTYAWCATTSQINVWVYVITFNIALGSKIKNFFFYF